MVAHRKTPVAPRGALPDLENFFRVCMLSDTARLKATKEVALWIIRVALPG